VPASTVQLPNARSRIADALCAHIHAVVRIFTPHPRERPEVMPVGSSASPFVAWARLTPGMSGRRFHRRPGLGTQIMQFCACDRSTSHRPSIAESRFTCRPIACRCMQPALGVARAGRLGDGGGVGWFASALGATDLDTARGHGGRLLVVIPTGCRYPFRLPPRGGLPGAAPPRGSGTGFAGQRRS
jgi:hypothetical protein